MLYVTIAIVGECMIENEFYETMEATMSDFDKVKVETAINIYNSILDNYDPIPKDLEVEKEMIIASLELAWINGANWGTNRVLKEGKNETTKNIRRT